MIAKVERVLGDISWTRRDVAEFLGRHLTEPKPNVLFAPPQRPLSALAFAHAARRKGVELALASLMLYGRTQFFINGEQSRIDAAMAMPLRRLADSRRLPGRRIPLQGPVTDRLYGWYRAGYISLSN
jgi:50S ribosomal protein L16 3-hydroxylase